MIILIPINLTLMVLDLIFNLVVMIISIIWCFTIIATDKGGNMEHIILSGVLELVMVFNRCGRYDYYHEARKWLL